MPNIVDIFFKVKNHPLMNATWSHSIYCTWVHFLERHDICTNNYILLQFPKDTRGSKTLTPFYCFSHKCAEFRLIKRNFSHNYLKNIMLRLQNNIQKLGDLKTDAFER